MKKIILSIIVLTASTGVLFAQEAGAAGESGFYNLMLGLIIVLAIILLFAVIALQRSVNSLRGEMNGNPTEHLSLWEQILSLKPLSYEKDMDIGHDYDGIRELSNPVPVWFNVLFYGTVIFGIAYLIIYHGLGAMPLQAQEYKNEMAAAQIQKEDYLKKSGNAIDENTVKLITDASKLQDAKKIFIERCVVCHGANAEGKVGPNLTDEYWLHGGKLGDIFKTIKNGVPAKGMVSWQNVLKPYEIQLMASYVISLQGTNPPGAKEPQGEKMVQTTTAPSDSLHKDSVAKK